MSHFSTLVIVEAEDNKDVSAALWTLEEMLEPYREARFNPISKWDYWVLGGRWAGELICKADAVGKGLAELNKDREDKEKIFAPNQVDICRFDMLDLETMRQSLINRKRLAWQGTQEDFAKSAGRAFSEEKVDRLRRQLLNKDNKLRKSFKQKERKEGYYDWCEKFLTLTQLHRLALLGRIYGSEPYENIQDWINDVCGFSTYAFVDSDNWHEKERRWFDIPAYKATSDWEAALKERVRSIQPNDWVAIIDCHI